MSWHSVVGCAMNSHRRSRGHKVIDVLADRSAESVKIWLEAHPTGEIVSRDRGRT